MMLQNPAIRLILASASEARRSLLTEAGVLFSARAAAVDESTIKQAAQIGGETSEQAALLLAELKGRRIAERDPECVVIGADQILVCEGAWFSKPADMNEARVQLAALRGRTHELITAVLCQRGDQRLWQHVARPRLTMRWFSDAFLDDYLEAEGESVLRSVGAYRLEGRGVHLFARVEGEHAAILGLPLLPLLEFLRQHGVLNG
jgi:septum formation protein